MKYLIVIFFCYAILGCQTPLTDAFNASVFPPEDPGDYALLPLTFPVGLVLPVIDVAIVNPVYGAIGAPDAVSRFWDLGKDSPGLSGALIPVKVLGTPFVFLGYILFGEQFLPIESWSWFRPKAKKAPESSESSEENKTPVPEEERERRKREAELQLQEIKDLK
ncbi:MAG: hypothetical protein AABZ60_09565 [Planctomycetota bacterium]